MEWAYHPTGRQQTSSYSGKVGTFPLMLFPHFGNAKRPEANSNPHFSEVHCHKLVVHFCFLCHLISIKAKNQTQCLKETEVKNNGLLLIQKIFIQKDKVRMIQVDPVLCLCQGHVVLELVHVKKKELWGFGIHRSLASASWHSQCWV